MAFTLSRKRSKFLLKASVTPHGDAERNPDNPLEPIAGKRNGMAFDALIVQLQMGTHVCIADFEYLISKKGEPYGWGVARYCTPEAMYPDLFDAEGGLKGRVEGRTPEQSRGRIIAHLQSLFPDVEKAKIEKLIS